MGTLLHDLNPPSHAMHIMPHPCRQDVLTHVSRGLDNAVDNGLDGVCGQALTSSSGIDPPYIHPLLPAVILPGRGPLAVDYSVAGEHVAGGRGEEEIERDDEYGGGSR